VPRCGVLCRNNNNNNTNNDNNDSTTNPTKQQQQPQQQQKPQRLLSFFNLNLFYKYCCSGVITFVTDCCHCRFGLVVDLRPSIPTPSLLILVLPLNVCSDFAVSINRLVLIACGKYRMLFRISRIVVSV
jgi:hypothetical protein